MKKRFSFLADTVNGAIMDFPVTVIMECGKVTPIGLEVVRQFDADYCIVATEVYLVLFNGDVYGTTQFSDFDGCMAFLNSECVCCPTDCYLTINGCYATINGCWLVVPTTKAPCLFTINGCMATINGCSLNFLTNNN